MRNKGFLKDAIPLIPGIVLVVNVLYGLAMFFPCIATFIVMARELGIKTLLKSAAIMLVAGLAVGGLLHLIFK